MTDPSPRSWRRFLAAFFLVNLVLASYFLDTWSTPNPVSRALPALTLVEEGTLKINTYASRSSDKAKVGEDYYSEKAPLPTFVMVPIYAALHATGLGRVDDARTGERFPIHIWKTVRGPDFDGRRAAFTKLYPLLLVGSFVCGSVPFALMVLLAFLAVGRTDTVVRPVVMVMMAFYGSYLFAFSGTFFGHILAGALLLGGYVLLKRGRYLPSGILVGLAFLTDYPAGIVVPIWLSMVWLHERSGRKMAAFAAGAAPSFAFMLLYNHATTGNPLRTLNAYHAVEAFGAELGSGYGFGVGNLGWESLWGLSFSFYMGLFIFVPVLLVVLVELLRPVSGGGRRTRVELRGYVPLAAAVYFLLIASFFSWWGGWSFGPRYLIPPACLLVYEGLVFLSARRYSRGFFLAATTAGLASAWLAKSTLLYMIPDGSSMTRAAPAAGSHPVLGLLLPEMLEGRFNANTLPSIALGVPPKLAVFLWPLLFVGGMLLLDRLQPRAGAGASAPSARERERSPRPPGARKKKKRKQGRRGSVRVVTLLCAFAVGVGGCSSGEAPAPDAVFLIVVDTLRPDRLSCYGYEAHATPNIDALARRGVRFSRAQSVASWTIPSMGAMMTSRYPTQLGLTETPAPEGKRFAWQELRDQQNWTLSRGEHTLAEAFRQAGYRTAAFIDQPGLIAYGGFFQGFDDVYFPISARAITRFEPGKLEYPRWPPFLRDAFGNDEELIVRFEAWLAESGSRKMFVWLHLLTPHWPYDPAPSYMPNGEAAETDEQQLEERFYNGEVRAVDDLIGRIARAIDEHVGLGRSVIVFTSDHGEGLGEHGMHDHGHSLHAEVIEVPLILSAPSLPDRGAVDLDVRTIDIAPTLLDLVGRGDAVPPDFEGTSLLPLIEGDDVVLPVFSQAMLYGETERSLGGGNFKLMYDEQEESYRLFDMLEDPAEVHDVASSHPETVERLRDALAAIHEKLLADRAGRPSEAPASSAEQDARMFEALRSLGYVR